MSTFSKKLQKFFIYFFTGVSAVVIVLGINRAKETNALGINPVPDNNNSDTSSESSGQNIIKDSSILGTSVALLDKTVTARGTSHKTPWGNLTTKIQVKNGKIVAVEIPELPDSPPSIYAEPYLIDQALRSGSSNIQGVTGATATTNAFKSSLESALATARKQGGTPLVSSTKVTSAKNTSTQTKNTSQTTTQPPSYVLPPVYIPPQTETQPIPQPTLTQTVPRAGVSGTFTGNPFSTKWGNAVASITVTNGKITGVTMPQVPNSPPSIDAEPFLISQALASGNANIQGVSGATVVSNAFRASLENAIAKANAQATAQGAFTVVTSPTTSNTSITSGTNTTIPNSQPTASRNNRRYHDDDDDD